MQTREFDCCDNLAWQLPRIAMGTSGLVFLPVMPLATGLVTLNPFVNPRPRVTKLLGNRRYRFTFQVRADRMFSVALLFLLHAFLPKEKGSDNETTSPQSDKQTNFQRTVNHVMAILGVNNVVARIT
jgi:hypothetical protein